MKTIIQDVINLSVYGEDGSFITKIETVTESVLNHETNGHQSYLIVKDALFNLKMLENIGEKVENEELNDFEKNLSKSEDTVIKFKKVRSSKDRPKFKLIGEGIMYSPETGGVSHDFKIVIPNAIYTDGFKLNLDSHNVQTPSYVFEIDMYNDDGDMFDIRLTERK